MKMNAVRWLNTIETNRANIERNGLFELMELLQFSHLNESSSKKKIRETRYVIESGFYYSIFLNLLNRQHLFSARCTS